ncbi:MAG TPA: hypothetical protein VM260_01275, partial [Pirellula sp.]|nr:hypothetical protein [Pirellula sp.]
MLKSSSAWNVSFFIYALMLSSLTLSPVVLGQDTIQFGFEEYGENDHPLFVTGPATVENGSSLGAYHLVTPFEGTKFLVVGPGGSIQSPNGLPIQSFTMHLFLPLPNPWYVSVGGQGIAPVVREWQIIQRTFDSPVQSLSISAF